MTDGAMRVLVLRVVIMRLMMVMIIVPFAGIKACYSMT